ncbi:MULTISPECIES: hypothetical protein [Pandoraea]|uniref:Uncharacterized protein n=2 Tax=Pandoraea TaxID=93217 RepID=A0A5E4VMQ3_9BURK|nr:MULTISPECIES: hypothetical protein [Pandoraea]ALS61299.1 hypothetical protein AT302_17470 [Pandoraea norimbergensis]VVE12305.1 hypothetical protein PIN31115_02683 [Pandoraea iniqua]VVE20438.1 hypothetical protein PIN31009_03101 [Pandoraea iniqua]
MALYELPEARQIARTFVQELIKAQGIPLTGSKGVTDPAASGERDAAYLHSLLENLTKKLAGG